MTRTVIIISISDWLRCYILKVTGPQHIFSTCLHFTSRFGSPFRWCTQYMESQSLGHAELCLTASSRLFGVCRRQTGCAFRHVEPIRKELKHDGKRRNRRKKNTAELNDGDETRRKEQKITLNTLHVANRLIIPTLFMISLFVPSPFVGDFFFARVLITAWRICNIAAVGEVSRLCVHVQGDKSSKIRYYYYRCGGPVSGAVVPCSYQYLQSGLTYRTQLLKAAQNSLI